MLKELKHLVPHYDIGREPVMSSEPCNGDREIPMM